MPIKIICDCCKRDLTVTHAMPRFRLILRSEAVPKVSAPSYDIMVYPDIERDHCFCNLVCLGRWLDETKAN